jgi:hypothetical protein
MKLHESRREEKLIVWAKIHNSSARSSGNISYDTFICMRFLQPLPADDELDS